MLYLMISLSTYRFNNAQSSQMVNWVYKKLFYGQDLMLLHLTVYMMSLSKYVGASLKTIK